MKRIRKFLWILMHPIYWCQNERYSEKWDNELNNLIENYKFEYVDEFTAKIGNVEVWIGNYPYSCMAPYKNYKKIKIRPSRQTIHKAYEKCIKEIKYQYDEYYGY